MCLLFVYDCGVEVMLVVLFGCSRGGAGCSSRDGVCVTVSAF